MEMPLMDELVASSSIALVGVLFSLMILKCLVVQFMLQMSSLRYAFQFSISFILNSGQQQTVNQTKITTTHNSHKACNYKRLVAKEANRNDDSGDKKLRLGELGSVMEELGNLCDHGSNETFADLFEDELSLEEVKEAFNMFDENADGFIDVGEVKKVLNGLGFTKASESECANMIKVFDNNGDGRIDFMEFVKLMEDSCCLIIK